MTVKRGEVYTADLSGSIGHEQTGNRPVIVIQNDRANQNSETVIVACITSKEQARRFITHVTIRLAEGQFSKFSRVMLEQIRTIDKRRILNRVGQADESSMKVLDSVLAYSLGLTDKIPSITENNDSNDKL
ncbi:MAG: type II toxin-antitoxin system PemK/MazF family toxin [Firmicutes bacterium]|nr:type II toxin-antitoxin system PemK/MazF family toxin [Clostridia bacterium]MBR0126732.1 type II toxin-antitoxin system PemK/MazF family toxin [Bacillota bacterium]